MARVVKLPSGLIFRDRESIGRRVTAKGTPAGMKGQFGAKAIGQFIDLADKVVSSKAIGAVTSAIEGGLEDTPEQAKAKLKKEAAEKRAQAKAKAKAAAAPPPPPPKGAVPGWTGGRPTPAPEDEVPGAPDSPTVGPAKVAPTPDPSIKQQMRAELEKRATAKAAADAEATAKATARAEALAKAESPPAKSQPTREPILGRQPAMRPPREVKKSIERDAVEKPTESVPLSAPATPAVDLPQAATRAAPPGGSATAKTPTAPPPAARAGYVAPRRVAPVAGQKEPVVESAPPVGDKPAPKTTVQKSMKALTQEAQEKARQLVSNLGVDIMRDRPVDAATIKSAAFDVANKDAVNAASFLAEYVKAFDKLGLSKQPQAPINIPKTVSAEALIGYARMAQSSANQQKVLEAFANNTVTGMGYTTLAERLSGSYRKPYLSAILKSFPKPAKAKDPIDAIYKATLAYQTGMGGRLKSQREQMGYVGAEIAGKRATTAATGAKAQLTAEQAVTERELRYTRRGLLASKIVKTLINPQLIKIIGLRKRVRGRKRVKPNLAEIRKATTDPITAQMKDIEARRGKLNDAITQAMGAKNALPELKASYEATIVGSPARATAAKEWATAKKSASRLTRLKDNFQKIDDLHSDLSDRRKKAAKVITRLALGHRPSKEDMKAVGLTVDDLKDMHLSKVRHRRRRKRKAVPQAKPKDPLKLRE